jgi:hypothetical protein
MAEKNRETATSTTAEDRRALQGDAGEKEVQQRVDQEQEQGFVGTEVDPTPNENYTVQGVAAGKPTPETDAGAAKEARDAAGIGQSGLEAAERERERVRNAPPKAR